MSIEEVQAKLDAAEAVFNVQLRAFKLADANYRRSKSNKNAVAFVQASEAFDAIATECRDLQDALAKAHRMARRAEWHQARNVPEQMALF